MFLFNFRANEINPWYVAIFNFEKKEITHRLIPRSESFYPDLAMIKGRNFTFANGKHFFSCCNIWGLYQFANNDFQKIINFDIGSRQVPSGFVNNITATNNRIKFRELALEKGYVPYLLNSFYFKSHYWIILDDKERSCYSIPEENRNKVFLNGPVSSYFDLPAVHSLSLPMEVNEDYLVFVAKPTDFIKLFSKSDKMKIKLGTQQLEIGLEENPFLVVVK
ncbi:hypothetical protein [Maribellus maritimus]|uniref:hypothetical protein n=1 Tax=Maribellus maritimus TaxID=2870838 RepID=UPI001EEAF4D2|nr:hypothetical protein [Maribellus maritimus]MCG6188044.1 hypothetical protein [Maribellus maritimus]